MFSQIYFFTFVAYLYKILTIASSLKNYTTEMEFSPIIIGTMRLGSWGAQLDTEALERFIDASIDLGFSHFDHADIYGHYTEEERFGRVLKRRPDLKTKLQITTKCGIRLLSPNRPQHRLKSYDATAAHLVWSAENSLRELGVDQLDVFTAPISCCIPTKLPRPLSS